jgi:hypothetical protein
MFLSVLDGSIKFHIMLDFYFSYGLGETLLSSKYQNKCGHFWLVDNLRVESKSIIGLGLELERKLE